MQSIAVTGAVDSHSPAVVTAQWSRLDEIASMLAASSAVGRRRRGPRTGRKTGRRPRSAQRPCRHQGNDRTWWRAAAAATVAYMWALSLGFSAIEFTKRGGVTVVKIRDICVMRPRNRPPELTLDEHATISASASMSMTLNKFRALAHCITSDLFGAQGPAQRPGRARGNRLGLDRLPIHLFAETRRLRAHTEPSSGAGRGAGPTIARTTAPAVPIEGGAYEGGPVRGSSRGGVVVGAAVAAETAAAGGAAAGPRPREEEMDEDAAVDRRRRRSMDAMEGIEPGGEGVARANAPRSPTRAKRTRRWRL